MRTQQAVPVRVHAHGQVPEGMRELAAAKAGATLRHASRPVLSARVTLLLSADPAVRRPASALATVDLNGRIVRAHAADETMLTAIEHMAARLKVRLERSAGGWTARRGTLPAAEAGEWRHRSGPTYRSA